MEAARFRVCLHNIRCSLKSGPEVSWPPQSITIDWRRKAACRWFCNIMARCQPLPMWVESKHKASWDDRRKGLCTLRQDGPMRIEFRFRFHFTQVSRNHECAHISTFNPEALDVSNSNSPFVRSYLRPKVQTKVTKGIRISNLMFTERIKAKHLGSGTWSIKCRIVADWINQCSDATVCKRAAGGFTSQPLTRLVSFSHSTDTSFEMHLLFLAKQAIASSYLAGTPQWTPAEVKIKGKRCLLCESCKLCMMIGFHDNWQLAQCCTSIFLGNVISHAGCCCCNRWQKGL